MKLLLTLCAVASALAGDATLRAMTGANDVVMLGGIPAMSKPHADRRLASLDIKLVESVTNTDTVLQLEAKAGKDAEIVFVDDGGGNRVALVKPHDKAELHLVGGSLFVNGTDVLEARRDLETANARIAQLEQQLAECNPSSPTTSHAWQPMSSMSTTASSEHYSNSNGPEHTLLSHNASAMHGGDEVFWQADFGHFEDQWLRYISPTAVTINEFRYQPILWDGPGTEPKEMYLYVNGGSGGDERFGPFNGPSVDTMHSVCLDNFKQDGRCPDANPFDGSNPCLIPGEGQCLDLPFVTFELPKAVTGNNFTFWIKNTWGYERPSQTNSVPAVKRFAVGMKTVTMDPLAQCDGYKMHVVDDAGVVHNCPPPEDGSDFPLHGTRSTVPHVCAHGQVIPGLNIADQDCVMEFNGVDTRYFESAEDVLYDRSALTAMHDGDMWVQMKVRADGDRDKGTLFDMGSDEQHVRLEYFTRSDGATYIGFRVKTNESTTEVWNLMTPGEWHWVRATMASGTLTMQVDGSLSTLAAGPGVFDWSTFQKDCVRCDTNAQLTDCINVGARATPGAYNRVEQAYNYFKGQITEFGMGNQVGSSPTEGVVIARPLSQCNDDQTDCARPDSFAQGNDEVSMKVGHWESPTMISGYPTTIAACT